MSDVDSIPGRREEIKSLCEKVLPVFEQLEKVDEVSVLFYFVNSLSSYSLCVQNER